jgi:hypothetical protein
MFSLNKAMQVLDQIWNAGPSGVALTWNTPVQFDATLVTRLIDEHRELSARFAQIVSHLDKVPAVAEHTVRECAERLHELRRTEALWLYPVIARGFAPDPIARRLVWQSRLVMLGLARRVLRRFDELVRAIRNGTEIGIAADHVAKALAEYQRRNEEEMYPLYALMERLCVRADSRAA